MCFVFFVVATPVYQLRNSAFCSGVSNWNTSAWVRARATATSAELSVMLEESVGEGLIADEEAELLARSLSFVQRTAADVGARPGPGGQRTSRGRMRGRGSSSESSRPGHGL